MPNLGDSAIAVCGLWVNLLRPAPGICGVDFGPIDVEDGFGGSGGGIFFQRSFIPGLVSS